MTEKPAANVRLRVVRAADDAAASVSTAYAAPYSLDALYRQHARYVAAVARRLLGRDAELDDIVQDVFLEAVRGIDKLREPAAVKGWLAKVTVRLAVRRLRKRKLLTLLHLELQREEYGQLSSPGATPDERALITTVYRTLDGLPARTRVIWILRHVIEEPLHSIVELTGCSQSTVQRKLRDAESLLDKELHHE